MYAGSVVRALSIALIFVRTRTATAFGFEVVDGKDELLAAGFLGETLHFLAVLNIGVVVLHIAVRGDFVGAIDISRLGDRAVCDAAVVDVGEVSASVLREVGSYFG